MNPAIYALVSVLGGGFLGVLLKARPERRDLTVGAAQRAVALMAQTMEELRRDLGEASDKIDELTEKLERALARAHELEASLDSEKRKVQQLQRQLRDLADRQSDLDEGANP